MLTVYRASAGAGKTHKLTGEYLNLLFARGNSFRRILAVTFTNKATDEMKTRIIQELHLLANGSESDYLGQLVKEHSKSEEQIRKEAKSTLIDILHDYSSFNISTIDRFFQQTMRAFTREIGLQGGYGIEMDQELVLSEVIDQLLGDLEKPENKDLLGWLLRFAEDKIENGGDWKLNRDIMSLSREVFKESYKQFNDEVTASLRDKETLENYKNDLFAIIRSVESEAKRLGEKGLNILNRFGLQTTDFIRGTNSPLRLLEKLAAGEMKEPTATFIKLEDNVDGCYAKSAEASLKQLIGCVFENGLNDCIKGICSLFSELTDYYTAKEIIRYYYTLGILTDVSAQLAAYREEKNIMLIADTTELLNKVIDNSDAPFIYEKTGTGIDHYMIDEFQDTSGMQWYNFRPLVKESLSHNRTNLIVGDIKQSIYRFRNSDWKLLDEQVQTDFMPGQVTEETLKDNWRSFRHIVEFNNSLFANTPAVLQLIFNESLSESSLTAAEQERFQTRIMKAYRKSYQQVPSKFQDKEGHVQIEFLTNDEEADWKEKALEKLPATLEELQRNGYALKDIAILVRTNLEGAMVANMLLGYKEEHPESPFRYDIISDDALFIHSSTAIRFIIALLRHLKNPDDTTNRQMARFTFATLTGNFMNGSADLLKETENELQMLSHHSLYEMVEGIYRLYSKHFPTNEHVFVQAFLDMVSEFNRKERADLSRFLKWWDESGHKKTIHTPDSQNAIRILTIHKSKGLGFKTVIIPFGDWEIDHKPTKPVILWCQPRKQPFNLLQLVPVKYSSVLAKTIFAEDYYHEKLHAFIDNLNTLYVAFTRAKEELIVFAPRPKKIKEKTGECEKVNSIAELLWTALLTPEETIPGSEPLISLPGYFNQEEGLFRMGDWWKTPPPAVKKEKKQTGEITMEHFVSVSPNDRLELRLKGKGFFFDDPRRKHGTVMHEILSLVKTVEDIPAAVENYYINGLINREEVYVLQQKLEEILHRPEVNGWFNGSGTVLNEVDILFNRGMSRRPDRIIISDRKVSVIDYKFGEQKEKRHHRQVQKYMELISRMGYQDVNGYLWYVELNEIETVGQ
ncbi:MAG: UvrD-helicase domain-containing protein [Tannerellaceae bacterium]|nr:UvrD-helicase domain-containing protein [Tannerellaceae bacterium]